MEGSQSVREMAEGQDQQEELFPGGVFAGDEMSLRDLIKPGHKVEATVSIRAAEFDSPEGGLLRPTRKGFAVVGYQWEKPEMIPRWEDKPRDENPEIKGWKIRQVLKPITIEKVSGEADIIAANFAVLMSDDPQAGAALLDRLQEVAAESLKK